MQRKTSKNKNVKRSSCQRIMRGVILTLITGSLCLCGLFLIYINDPDVQASLTVTALERRTSVLSASATEGSSASSDSLPIATDGPTLTATSDLEASPTLRPDELDDIQDLRRLFEFITNVEALSLTEDEWSAEIVVQPGFLNRSTALQIFTFAQMKHSTIRRFQVILTDSVAQPMAYVLDGSEWNEFTVAIVDGVAVTLTPVIIKTNTPTPTFTPSATITDTPSPTYTLQPLPTPSPRPTIVSPPRPTATRAPAAVPTRQWTNQSSASACRTFDYSVCFSYLPAPRNCAEVRDRGIPSRVAACCFPARDGDKDGEACYQD